MGSDSRPIEGARMACASPNELVASVAALVDINSDVLDRSLAQGMSAPHELNFLNSTQLLRAVSRGFVDRFFREYDPRTNTKHHEVRHIAEAEL